MIHADSDQTWLQVDEQQRDRPTASGRRSSRLPEGSQAIPVAPVNAQFTRAQDRASTMIPAAIAADRQVARTPRFAQRHAG
jgi:hypothetical protein